MERLISLAGMGFLVVTLINLGALFMATVAISSSKKGAVLSACNFR